MKRTRTTAVAVLMVLAFVVLVSISAPAISQLGVGASVNLYSSDKIERHTGLTQLTSIANVGGEDVAFYSGGMLVIPRDSYGVFEGYDQLIVSTLTLGVDPKRITDVSIELEGDGHRAEWDDKMGYLRVGIKTLPVGRPMAIVVSATNNAGKKDTHGLIPAVLRVVSFGALDPDKRIKSTDVTAQVFAVMDADKYVSAVCETSFDDVDPAEMSRLQRRIVKAAFYEEHLKGCLKEAHTDAGYAMLMTHYINQLMAQPDEQVEALKVQVAALQGQIDVLITENLALRDVITKKDEVIAELQEQLRLASTLPDAPSSETEGISLKSAVVTSWVGKHRVDYAGKTGWIFQVLGPDGEPTKCEKSIYLWLLEDQGDGTMKWVPNIKNPVTITGYDVWFNTPPSSARAFGVSYVSNDEPLTAFPVANNDLHILGIPLEGGTIHEVVH